MKPASSLHHCFILKYHFFTTANNLTMKSFAPLLLLPSAAAFSSSSIPNTRASTALHGVNGIWNNANDFGKGKFRFYDGLDSYMKPFPDEDRELYPEMFKLPKGTYE
eukprot:scaffold31241_cov76-Skeletonema_marinoi.AAC.1